MVRSPFKLTSRLSFLNVLFSELVVGQIIKADKFTMFEAMSAVEVHSLLLFSIEHAI